jgi:hypothetical protein
MQVHYILGPVLFITLCDSGFTMDMHPHFLPFPQQLFNTFQIYPGRFLLSYLPHTRFRHEYMTVTPEGFRFRQRMFGSIGSLIRWFKKNTRSIPGTPSTPRGAVQPTRTPYVNVSGTSTFYLTENVICFCVMH